MTARYTPTVMDGTAHMEIMGAGEWVRWEDYDRAMVQAILTVGKCRTITEACAAMQSLRAIAGGKP
jgi:hypothetical protein